MNIGMLLNGSYPSDIRVRKEAETLSDAHSVFVLCTKKPTEKPFEIVNGVHIIRAISYKSLAHEGIIDVLASINFVHPYFKKALPRFIEENSIEVLHVHDLPLAKTAKLAAKKYVLGTVLDLHENYPAALLTWFSWRTNPIIRLKNKLFFGYEKWRAYEAKIVKQFDYVIAVVSEMKDRLIEQHQLSPEKIVIVANAEKKEFAKNFEQEAPNYFLQYPDKFIISYVGGFGPHRGLHTAIKGMKIIKEQLPNALLVLVGPANKDVTNHLQQLIVKNQVENTVIIKGSVPFNEVINIMKSSQLNIIPHTSNEHTESAVPHKFFQILLSGKPLLVSDCKPMKRLVIDHQIGSYFEAESPESFAEAVIDIATNYNVAMKKAANGTKHSLEGNLNWEHLSANLVHLYDNFKK